MASIPTHPILWDIYEEHLDEATWLWGEWEASLDSPLYAIGDVAIGPEERLLAHLDGLVLGGQAVARKLLVPALGSDDANAVAASAWALVQAEDADHQDAVLAALSSGEPPVRKAIGRALSLCPRADLSRLVALWDAGTPEVQAMVMDILAPREPDWGRTRIEPALRGGQPPLMAAALRAIRRSRDNAFLNYVQYFLQSGQGEVLREAMLAGLLMGVKVAWNACRTLSNAKDASCRLPLGILATSPDPNDRAAVRAKVADPDVGAHALWALGFVGEVESADLAVQMMAAPEQAKLAGEVFAVITGIAIAGPLAKPGEAQGPDAVEVPEDAPPPEVKPEDFLPEPDVAAVKRLWEKERARFGPGMRYLGGQPHAADSVRAGLLAGATWRREVLLFELSTTGKALPPKVELKTWAHEQQKQLAAG
jgi:uncharacterized protein (TIGR02270 family)